MLQALLGRKKYQEEMSDEQPPKKVVYRPVKVTEKKMRAKGPSQSMKMHCRP